nr:MAG TPA: hypothetical protein [Herelleviridae sp.]
MFGRFTKHAHHFADHMMRVWSLLYSLHHGITHGLLLTTCQRFR